MQSAYLWEHDDGPELSPIRPSSVRSILRKRQMCARAVVVVDILREDPARVALVEDDDVIQALATERSDEALRVGVMPRRPRGNGDLTKTQSRDALPELRSMDPIAIADQVPKRVSSGSASTICCAVQAAVGWAVTWM